MNICFWIFKLPEERIKKINNLFCFSYEFLMIFKLAILCPISLMPVSAKGIGCTRLHDNHTDLVIMLHGFIIPLHYILAMLNIHLNNIPAVLQVWPGCVAAMVVEGYEEAIHTLIYDPILPHDTPLPRLPGRPYVV